MYTNKIEIEVEVWTPDPNSHDDDLMMKKEKRWIHVCNDMKPAYLEIDEFPGNDTIGNSISIRLQDVFNALADKNV